MSNPLGNHEIFKKKLIEEFQVDAPFEDIYQTESRCLNDLNIHDKYVILPGNCKGQKWNEIDLHHFSGMNMGLDSQSCEILVLTKAGERYYLPAFISYFYDVKMFDLNPLMGNFFIKMISSISYEESTEYFTPLQLKLIALCLINAANFLPPIEWGSHFQSEINKMWGNFLLF